MAMKGNISNPTCNVLSIDPEYNEGCNRSICFDLTNLDQNLLYLENGVAFENISQSGTRGISVNIINVSNQYLKDNDVFGMSGDPRKGNHLSYFLGQGVFATLFMGPEIFDDLFTDLKRKVVPKNFSFEFFKIGFSDPCITNEKDGNSIIWDVAKVKLIHAWGIAFAY